MFDVYNLLDIEPVKAEKAYFWDRDGNKYLDFYGGHAVISIGHSHLHYVELVTGQLNRIGFYSNAVKNHLQEELERKLRELSGCTDYNLFLCNSGAEANENALKLSSFITGRSKILAMHAAFHGRTSGAVAITDNPTIQAPWNRGHQVTFIDLNDVETLKRELSGEEYAAVIVEGIQGVGGIRIPTGEFLRVTREVCDQTGTLLMLDRAGHDHYGERNGQRIPGSRSIDSQVDQGGEGDVGNHIRGKSFGLCGWDCRVGCDQGRAIGGKCRSCRRVSDGAIKSFERGD